ncbi:MAG: hypothetical protein ABI700_33295 [Chloroflexota bacterium]
MADDIINTLRSLANRWTLLARDYAKASKEPGATEAQISYNRGYAEGYYKAATELAALIKAEETAPQRPQQPRSAATQSPPPQGGGRRPSSPTPPPQQQRPAAPAQPAQPRPAAPPAPAPAQQPAVSYKSVSVGEAINILVFAGCQPRDVITNKDNSLRATFSSWGSMMIHEQVTRVSTADPRIVILNSGKLESHDYFIDFAFKDN